MNDFWLGVICTVLFLLISFDVILWSLVIKNLKKSEELDEQLKKLQDNVPQSGIDKYRDEDGLLSGKRKT